MKQKIMTVKNFVFALVTMLVAAAVAFAFSFNGSARFVKAEDEATPTAVYVIGATDDSPESNTYSDFAAGWNAAISASTAGTGNNLIKVELASDWTASAVEAAGEETVTEPPVSFGTGNGFSDHRIYVPANANIILDLQGHTVDRNLAEAEAVANGGVIIVDNGASLTVIGGKVTGGNSTGDGGAIFNNGNLTVKGTEISGNKALGKGGAIYNTSTLTVANATLTKNESAEFGGAIYSTGTLEVNDSTITENVAEGGNVMGGAIAIYGGTAEINGGSITGNKVTGKEEFIEVPIIPEGGLQEGEEPETELVSAGTPTAIGGGLWIRNGVTVTVSGATVIKNNEVENDSKNESSKNIVLNGNAKLSAGELTSGAELYVSASAGTAFTQNYSENNNQNPNSYFKSDVAGLSFVVNSDGEVASVSGEVTYSGKYGEVDINNELTCNTFVYKKNAEFTVAVSFDGEPVEFVITKDGEEPKTDEEGKQINATVAEAGTYKITASVDGVEIAYTVVIESKKFTNTDLPTPTGIDDTYYIEDGEIVAPVFTLTYEDVELVEGTDYTFEYLNNKTFGNASVAVTFQGNYEGTVEYLFRIEAFGPDKKYQSVALEYYNGTTWSTNVPEWTYKNEDYTDKVRFALVRPNGGDTEYVYVAGGSNTNTTDMYLVISGEFDGQIVDRIKNATTYTVTVMGTSDLSFGTSSKSAEVTVNPVIVPDYDLITEEWTETTANRLWVADLGDGNTSQLRDHAVYYDPDGEYNAEYGTTVTIGTKDNAYVRYTGSAKKLVLNMDYVLSNGKTLASYFESGVFIGIDYTGNENVGNPDGVYKGEADAIIKLNGNWLGTSGNGIALYPKEWYIVNINNALRTIDDSGVVSVNSWTYGDDIAQKPFRPEHGDSAIYTITVGETVIARFAVKFTGNSIATSAASYYGVMTSGDEYLINERSPLGDDYFAEVLKGLNIGSYALNVYVGTYKSEEEHTHWYESQTSDAEGAVFYPINRTFIFDVTIYTMSDESLENDIEIVFDDDRVAYNATNNNIPELKLFFKGRELTEGIDYTLTGERITAGKADLVIMGEGNFTGTILIQEAYSIVQATNNWLEVPSIMYWSKGDYNKDVNFISATPLFLDSNEDLWFRITTDVDGNEPVEGLEKFGFVGEGKVSDEIANRLAGLEVGTYYLFATVESNTNYLGLSPRGIAFRVFAGVNAWSTTPTIATWTEGKFTDENLPVALAKFGDATIIVTDKEGNEIYNSATGLNELANAKYGEYILTAEVKASDEYSGLALYTVNFQIFKKPGIPGWGVFLIVLGALLIAAAVIFTLWKLGVFQILTDKLTLAIRTKATVDATIAAVRASRLTAQSKSSEEAAKALAAREARMKALMAAAQARRNMTPEEEAAYLEAKAAQAAKKAERLQKRSAKMNRRLERQRKLAEAQSAQAQTEQNTEAQNAETVENENGNTQE